MKRLFLLLLLAASGSALAQRQAAEPIAFSVSCETPLWKTDAQALARARQAADSASAAPGPQNLALAAAQADLALATARQFSPERDANRKAALDLAERAQAIWNAAPASPALAQEILARGRVARNGNHCALALSLLESALTVADKAAGPNDPVALPAVRELMVVATAIGDDPTVNALAPRLLAAVNTDTAPLDAINYATYLAAADHFYRGEDHERSEAVIKGLIDKVRANGADAAKLRRLNMERASIYYAQGRYQEAEALSAQAERPRHDRSPVLVEMLRVEEEMAVQVRSGRLQAALTMGEAQLARIGTALASAQAAQKEAESEWEAAKKEGARERMAAARTRYASARRDANAWQRGLADMESFVGEVQHALGHPELALPLYEKALAHYPTVTGAWVYAIERVRGDMALAYRARGDRTRALALQQQVRKTLLPLLGAQHPDVLEAEAQIAQLSGAAAQAEAPQPPASPVKRKK